MNATRSILALAWALALAMPSGTRADDSPQPGEMIDLTDAVVVAAAGRTGVQSKAVAVLVEEVHKRTQIRWPVADGMPDKVGSKAVIYVMVRPPARAGDNRRPEGFEIELNPKDRTVFVHGNDPRGVLFGVGRLLRELRLSRGKAVIPATFKIATAPRIALRGHQLGYRPKTNSYDAWDLAQWDQYIRDLAIFGTNAIELIPPRSDDDADSPHFPIPPMEALISMSKIADSYGMDVWIWYPAMDPNYGDPKTVEAELKTWEAVLSKIPRLDAVFVPGGDPGHTQPKILMAFLEKVTEVLHRSHPKAQMWMSPQGFNREWTEEFYEIMKQEPKWLTGLVHGPQIRPNLIELRKKIPARYPIRNYPDITHSRQCQFPVSNWDNAFAMTEGRETINPRPLGESVIFRHGLESSIGFLTYSEGCNDDVNKFIWSGLGWDPDMPIVEILRQYGRHFVSDRFSEGIAQGLLALETNWRGPLIANEKIETTLKQFQDMEKAATPQERLNWRFQQALYRAYYDATIHDRLIYETGLENQAVEVLARAEKSGSLTAMARAEAILDRAVLEPISLDRRARVFELAEALFQSVRMQLSVPRYQAIAAERGANLDTIDVPLNSRNWLKKSFAEIRQKGTELDRVAAIEKIVRWTDPGPGGFYDDLGNLTRQPHLVRGLGFAQDPDFRRSSVVGFSMRPDWPMSWNQHAYTLHEQPLQMHYKGLDPQARYKVRVVYAGDSFRAKVKLDSEKGTVHDWYQKPMPPVPVEFDVPAEATSDGDLTLSWNVEAGLGGNGRSNQVAEVWLIKKGR